MSLTEHRLIRYCVTKINRAVTNNPRAFTIDISEWNNAFATNDTSNRLKAACTRLMGRRIETKDPIMIEGELWDSAIFNMVEYAAFKDSVISISFTPFMMPLLEGLKGNHTSYPLRDVVRLKSVYAIQFYELFKQFLAIGERTMTVAEIREMFELESKYKVHKDFKKNVIDVAIDEINKHTPLSVSYEIDKPGRAVRGYKFKFGYTSKIDAGKTKEKELESEIKRIRDACEAGMVVSIKSKKTGAQQQIFGWSGDYNVRFADETTHNIFTMLKEKKIEVIIEPPRQENLV